MNTAGLKVCTCSQREKSQEILTGEMERKAVLYLGWKIEEDQPGTMLLLLYGELNPDLALTLKATMTWPPRV